MLGILKMIAINRFCYLDLLWCRLTAGEDELSYIEARRSTETRKKHFVVENKLAKLINPKWRQFRVFFPAFERSI